MKKYLTATLALTIGAAAYAQVGINTNTPASTLDIVAKTAAGNTVTTSEGLLVPRVDRARALSMASPATSTIIYVNDATTGSATGTAQNIDAAGFYYFDGSFWVKWAASAASSALNVTAELTTDYTVAATDDIILINSSAPVYNLTLPTSGVTVGKRLYVSQIGSANVALLPSGVIRNSSYNSINGGNSATLIYLGSGKWDVVSGY